MSSQEQGYGGASADEQFSMFRLYAVGRIAQDLPYGQRMAEVYLDERLPSVDANLTDEYQTLIGVSQTASGRAELSQVKAAMTTRCQWLALASDNRVTPPDVCAGERVLVYRLADTDQYYWVTVGDDTRLRKLETVVVRISATPENKETKDHSNSYILIVDSRTGLIMLTTSTANGEFSAWEFHLDLRRGTLVVNDGADNTLSWISAIPALLYKNAKGSSVTVSGEDIAISCKGTLKAASNKAHLTAPGGTTIKSDVKIDGSLHVTGSITSDAAIKGQTVSNATTTLVS